jgi:SOS-response transcriptional repressor LexA
MENRKLPHAKLPTRQEAVLDAIATLRRERGYAPTIRELCEFLGVSSPATVHEHLKALEARGLIARPARQSRRIEILHDSEPPAFVSVPLLEEIRHGSAFFDASNVVEFLPLPARWVQDNANLWMLRLPSDATPGVCARGPFAPGDYLLLRHAPDETPHIGETVALPEAVSLPVTAPQNNDASTQGSTRIVMDVFQSGESRPLWGRILGVFRPPIGRW